MPIVKYKCTPCGLDNVKQFLYRYNPKTEAIDLRICDECGTPVQRVWGKPPQSWYRSIRGGRDNE